MASSSSSSSTTAATSAQATPPTVPLPVATAPTATPTTPSTPTTPTTPTNATTATTALPVQSTPTATPTPTPPTPPPQQPQQQQTVVTQPKLRTPMPVGSIPTLSSELPKIDKGGYEVNIVFDITGSISEFAAFGDRAVACVVEQPNVTFGGSNIVLLRTEIVEMTSNCSNCVAIDIPGGVDTVLSANNMGYKAAVLPYGRLSHYVVYSNPSSEAEQALAPLAFGRRFPADPKAPGSLLIPATLGESLIDEQNKKAIEGVTKAIVKYSAVDNKTASVDSTSWDAFTGLLKNRVSKLEEHMINPDKPLKYEFKPVGCSWKQLEQKICSANPEMGRHMCMMPFVIACHVCYYYLLVK